MRKGFFIGFDERAMGGEERNQQRANERRWMRGIYYDGLRIQVIIYVYCSIPMFMVYVNYTP